MRPTPTEITWRPTWSESADPTWIGVTVRPSKPSSAMSVAGSTPTTVARWVRPSTVEIVIAPAPSTASAVVRAWPLPMQTAEARFEPLPFEAATVIPRTLGPACATTRATSSASSARRSLAVVPLGELSNAPNAASAPTVTIAPIAPARRPTRCRKGVTHAGPELCGMHP